MIYLLIPLLVSISIFSLIGLIKLFRGKVILETKAEYGTLNLKIEKNGYYSIWVFGKIFKKIPLQDYNTKILDHNGNKVFAIPSLFRANSNNGSSGTIQLKYYYLKKGDYNFIIEKESEKSLGFFEKTFSNIIPNDGSVEFGYKIKQTLPEYIFPILLLGILLPILGVIALLTGQIKIN